jgi:hypothetical protein
VLGVGSCHVQRGALHTNLVCEGARAPHDDTMVVDPVHIVT